MRQRIQIQWFFILLRRILCASVLSASVVIKTRAEAIDRAVFVGDDEAAVGGGGEPVNAPPASYCQTGLPVFRSRAYRRPSPSRHRRGCRR